MGRKSNLSTDTAFGSSAGIFKYSPVETPNALDKGDYTSIYENSQWPVASTELIPIRQENPTAVFSKHSCSLDKFVEWAPIFNCRPIHLLGAVDNAIGN